VKNKEKETVVQNMVEDLNEKLNKLSDSGVSEDEPEFNSNQSSSKDLYNFYNGIF